MNMNPSQYSRVVSSFFFAFILLFSVTVHASTLRKMIRNLSGVPQSQREKVFGILEDLDINPKNLYENQVRTLARALDDPVYLFPIFLMNDVDDLSRGTFATFARESDLFYGHDPFLFYLLVKHFFFLRFDLHRDSDALFTKLFTKKSGRKWKELPFQEAKRNWENILNATNEANDLGHTTITETDLEAAAISFVHQKFSDKYFSNVDVDFFYGLTHPSSWEEQSLGRFFHDRFSIDHYTNPHFTLTPEDSYHQFIMTMILDDFPLTRENLSLMNSKEFVLRIWKDITHEVSRRGSAGISGSVFLERIVDSLIEFKRSGSGDFLKAMEEAAREDDRLVQLVAIVDRFASNSNLENYRQNLLQQFRETPVSERNPIIYDFLTHTDLEEFVSQQAREENNYWRNALEQSRQSDPADAGTHL